MDLIESGLQADETGRRPIAPQGDRGGQAAQGASPRSVEATSALGTAIERLRSVEAELQARAAQLEGARAEARRYRELFDFAADGYLVTDADGVVVAANREIASLLGLAPSELVGRRLDDWLTGDDRTDFRDELGRLARRGERREWEVSLRRAVGEPVA